MKNLLKWPLLALLALTASAFQACDDDLEGIKPEEWDKTVSQTVEGVKFSLTPYAADEAEDGTLTFSGPCNDFAVGSYVWFLLDVENGTDKAIFLESLNDRIQIYNQYGAPVTLLTTSPASQPTEKGLVLQPGEKSSGIHMGILQHCWPADLLSKAIDCRPWTTRELATEGLFRALLSKPITVYEATADGDHAEAGKRLFNADLNLALTFVIR